MKGSNDFRQTEGTQAEATPTVQASGHGEHDISHSNPVEPKRPRWSAARKWIIGTAGAAIVIAGLVFAGNQYVDAQTVPYYHVYIGLAEHLKKQQKPHNNKDSKAHLSKSYAKEMFENHLKPLQME